MFKKFFSGLLVAAAALTVSMYQPSQAEAADSLAVGLNSQQETVELSAWPRIRDGLLGRERHHHCPPPRYHHAPPPRRFNHYGPPPRYRHYGHHRR